MKQSQWLHHAKRCWCRCCLLAPWCTDYHYYTTFNFHAWKVNSKLNLLREISRSSECLKQSLIGYNFFEIALLQFVLQWIFLWPKYYAFNPTKWSNTLKQFVGNRLKGYPTLSCVWLIRKRPSGVKGVSTGGDTSEGFWTWNETLSNNKNC